MTLPTLATTRLILRPVVEADAHALHPVFADDALMRYWSSAAHTNIGETRAYVAGNAAQGDWLTWAITERGEVALGWVTLGVHREGVRELGFILGRDHWGLGYAREAAKAVLDHGFGAMGLRRVFADADPDNAASNRLLDELGFTLEGRLRAEWETHIGVRDSNIWGLLREEWRR